SSGMDRRGSRRPTSSPPTPTPETSSAPASPSAPTPSPSGDPPRTAASPAMTVTTPSSTQAPPTCSGELMTMRWQVLCWCAANLVLACGDSGVAPDAGADASGSPPMVDAVAAPPIDAAQVPDAPPDAHAVVCGDGMVEQEEACDGEAPAGRTCVTQAFYQGTLHCTASCTLDTSSCSGSCGDGMVNGPERCDVALAVTESCRRQGFLGGVPACAPGCVPAGCTDGVTIDDVDVVFHGNGPGSHL